MPQPNIATVARIGALLAEMTEANAADGLLKLLGAVHEYALAQAWSAGTTERFTATYADAITRAMKARHLGSEARH